jgi:4-alpha-glucanotransferase
MSSSRVAGVVVPLFSIRTKRDWGIGQITDLPSAAAWARTLGHKLLQILPPYELAAGETSPYGARTAFGIDPIYIGLEAVDDLDPNAIEAALGADGARELARVRSSEGVSYEAVRTLKLKVLHVAFERFYARELEKKSMRAQAFRSFVERERHWCDDLALYVALREANGGRGWETWPEGERDRHADALAHAREVHAKAITEHQYLQWIAHTQWDRARGEMRGVGVELMGDLPFVVGRESADVWSRASQFRRDITLGAPPDGFTPDGQDWGLPPYDWNGMDADNLGWLRARTRHAARLYDRFRLDHVVGYFRMWVKKDGERGYFDPSQEHDQRARGESVLRAIMEEAGATRVIAEDLGVIPDFVRDVLRDLALPGYRVIPWEKDGDVFRDPKHFPLQSVASWGTHDTQPIAAWWNDFTDDERRRIAEMAGTDVNAPKAARNEAFLRLLLTSGSGLTLALAMEVLGETTRINTPGSVGPQNWIYRLPADIDVLTARASSEPAFKALAQMVAASDR